VNLSPGTHLLKYNQALAYVRNRHDLGGPDAGGDLPRIELQQAFISSVVQQVNATGLLSNVPKLLSIAGTATKALTVDSGLGRVSSLLTLARSLAHLHSKNVSLITMPTATDTFDSPTYSSRLVTVQPQDDVLFEMVRTGQNWTGQLPTEPYQDVQVRVLNATGQQDLAARTAARLRRLGFQVTGVGNAPYTATTTVDYAGLVRSDGAYTLMTALKSFPAGQDTLAEPASQVGGPGQVTLILGTNFTGVNPAAPPGTAQPAPAGKKARHKTATAGQPAVSAVVQNGPGAVQSRNGAANICSGLPSATGS
jgi:hypothetical protein